MSEDWIFHRINHKAIETGVKMHLILGNNVFLQCRSVTRGKIDNIDVLQQIIDLVVKDLAE